MAYRSIITTSGQSKLALFATSGDPIDIAGGEMAIGDGGGVAYEPFEAQAALVGEKWRGTVQSVSVQSGGVIIVRATVPGSSGGYHIREIGLFDGDGDLFAVTSLEGHYKPLPTEGANELLEISIMLDIGSAGAVTVAIAANEILKAVSLTRMPFITVDGIVTAPPGTPAAGALYAIGVSPTGLFAGKALHFAEWDELGWTFKAALPYTIIRTLAGEMFQRGNAAWDPFTAAPSTHTHTIAQVNGLQAELTTLAREATTTEIGRVRLATAQEVANSTPNRVVTADKLRDAMVLTGQLNVYSRAVYAGAYVWMEGTAVITGPGPVDLLMPEAFTSDRWTWGGFCAEASVRGIAGIPISAGAARVWIKNADGTAPGGGDTTLIKWVAQGSLI